MKKAISIVLCMALISVLAMAAFAEVAGDRARNQVNFAKGTAVIDGVKDDCYQAAGEIIADIPNASVEGTNFAKFTGYAVYDADAVYLYGHVSDPTLSANGGDWDGDSVEVFFNFDLAAGVGAADETDGYGDTGCMQFRMNPIPVDDKTVITVSGGHGLDDEVLDDSEANPGNYFCAVEGDGYTIECRFPFPSAKKAEVKEGYAIGFAIQINDAQEGTATEVAARTGTIHSVDGDQMEQGWQYAGAMGRAFFTAAEYVAPVEEVEPPVAEIPAEEAPAPEAPTAPVTADVTVIMTLVAAASAIGGAVVFKKRR